MNTYLMQAMNAISEASIDKYWVQYFRENFRGEINDKLLEAFALSGLTKAEIARKLDRRPEQITRWLSAPSNLESDTISDIALAIGMMPSIRFERIGMEKTNGERHEFIATYEAPILHENTGKRFTYAKSSYDSAFADASASTGTLHARKMTRLPSTGARIQEVNNA